MKVKLTKGNIWYLMTTLGDHTFKEVYYPEDTPDYILNYVRSKPYTDLYAISEWKDDDEIEFNAEASLNDRWPTEDEIKTESRKLYIDSKSWITKFMDRTTEAAITLSLKYADTDTKLVDEIPFGVVYRLPPENVEFSFDPECYDFLQYIPESNIYQACYRRNKLFPDCAKVKENTFMRCHVLYVSGPIKISTLNHLIKYDILVYDRTDNWSAKGLAEIDLIKNATVVLNSSEWLYKDSERIRGDCFNNYYVPNGCNVFEPEAVKKIDRYVYLGNNNFDKVDLDFMNKYPTDIYGYYTNIDELKDYPNLKYKGFLEEKDFASVLPKYKGGLIPFVKDDWTAGMLPIKYFVYKCAGLPVISTYDYGDIPVRDWSEIAKEIKDIIGNNEGTRYELVRRPEDTMSIWWSISKQCNFRCPYCVQTDKRVFKVDVDKVSKHLRTLMEKSKFKKFQISLLGGEPCLFDIETIIKNMSSDAWSLRVDLLTNFSLKDAEYYRHLQDLHPNTQVHICASCHISQIKDMDAWMQKVRDVGRDIHAKFVIGDSNFEETKKVIDKYPDIPMTFEGMRDSNHYPLFSSEIADFIRRNNDTQTDLIMKVHSLNLANVDCWRRLAIRGEEVHSGCKMKEAVYSIFYLKELDWIYRKCNLSRVCNLCIIQKLSNKIGEQ